MHTTESNAVRRRIATARSAVDGIGDRDRGGREGSSDGESERREVHLQFEGTFMEYRIVKNVTLNG